MTLDRAAKTLGKFLEGAPWLTAVGIGEHEGKPCIYVYVKYDPKGKLDWLNDGWEGHPVVVRRMGTPTIGPDVVSAS